MSKTLRPNYGVAAPIGRINEVIHECHGLPVKLVRYDGYHVFQWDDEDRGIYMETSVMEPYTSYMTLGWWVCQAQTIFEDMREEAEALLEWRIAEEEAAEDAEAGGQFGMGA